MLCRQEADEIPPTSAPRSFRWLAIGGALAILATVIAIGLCLIGFTSSPHASERREQLLRIERSSATNSSMEHVPGGFGIVRVKLAPGRQERYWDWTPLRVVEAGHGNVSFITSEGTYVSAHQDGNLSAYARSMGPDEVFERVQGNDTEGGSSVAFKSSIGTYLSVGQDGILSAGCDAIGDNETFTTVGTGDQAFVRSHGRVLAAVNTRLTLLTSSFVPRWMNYHLHEIYSAIEMNIQNPAIYDVHIMTESDCGELLKTFEKWADRISNTTVIRKDLHHKLRCVPSPTGVQPRYTDFFNYANNSLAGRLVVLANADIVFDETLRRIEPERILTGEIMFVLSVSPPPWNGRYKEVFGTDCNPTVKCGVGAWQGAPAYKSSGWSWDAYVFASPLPKKFNPSEANVVMNMMGAEYIAAYQFERSGVKVYNPCEYVHTYHWHCQGGKMHGARDNSWHMAVANIFPCSYCPGVMMPKEYGKKEDLCRAGVRQWNNQIPHYFKLPDVAASVCCERAGACGWMNMPSTPACKGPDDVNCIIWEFVGQHQQFLHR
jgi:hypothetical protein